MDYERSEKMDKCKTCMYRAGNDLWNNGLKCDYMSVVGTSRPCEPGNQCIVYKKGRRPNNKGRLK